MEAIGDPDATSIPKYGPLPVSVPGAVDGWCSSRALRGPAPGGGPRARDRAARGGAPITELIAYWNLSAGRLKMWPGFSEVFLPGGRAPRKGEVFANPALAKRWKRSPKAVARGSTRGASRVTRRLHEGERRVPHLRGPRDPPRRVGPAGVGELPRPRRLGAPPNGQGIAALQMLQILEGYDIASMGFGSADYLHVFTEAKKLAFADRARFYADPSFARARRGADLRGVRREEARDDR